MGSDADVADLTGLTGCHQGLQCAAGGGDGVQIGKGGVMNLIQFNIIGTEVAQAHVNVLGHALSGAGHGLGGQDELLPDALQSVAQIFLTDGVATGGIDVVDAAVGQTVDEGLGALGVDALDGDAAEAQGRDGKAGAAQSLIIHDFPSVRQRARCPCAWRTWVPDAPAASPPDKRQAFWRRWGRRRCRPCSTCTWRYRSARGPAC